MHDLLRGVRIIDLTSVVLGPYATQILGDMGAEIIKVEPLGGDVFRSVRPGHSSGMGAGFINCNRNKQSIAIDLSRPESAPLIEALVGSANCVIHNMRPASAAKLGIGYDQLRAIRPDIVYCYACGFGQDGRLAHLPAYDDTIQAASGLAHLNSGATGEPAFAGTIISDKVGGLHLALAALGGLLSNARTGKGCCIEAPMFESMVSFLLLEQLAGMSFQPPLGGMGYDRLQSPDRRPFPTQDSYISILPYTAVHWGRFLTLIGRDDLADAAIVTDGTLRSRHIDELYAIIAEVTPQRTTAEWLPLLRERDIPCSEVNRLEDLPSNDHLRDVDMFQSVRHPTEGDLLSVRSPFRVHGEGPSSDLPTPNLGEQTVSILSNLGLGMEVIEALVRDRIIGSQSEAIR